MAKKKTIVDPVVLEPTDTATTTGNEQVSPTDAKTTFVDSVIDGKVVKVEGYVTNTPINDTSKLIRYQEDDKQPENKYFTKK